MKLGFITSILENDDFEQMMDFASSEGFECVEVACWPVGKGERRYAGTCHIDVDKILSDENYKKYILDYSKEKNVEISSLAFYPNILDGNMEKSKMNIEHLKNVIRASAKLGVNTVTTFIGRDQNSRRQFEIS